MLEWQCRMECLTFDVRVEEPTVQTMQKESTIKVSDKDLYSTGPGTLAGEYFRRHWLPAGRSRDLAAGRARPVQLLSEHITVYRGKSGEVHAVQAACPHRATLLSTGWVEGDAIRCRYHGWKYSGNGSRWRRRSESSPTLSPRWANLLELTRASSKWLMA